MIWIDALKAVLHNQRGQGIVEYNLILLLVALTAITALALIGKYPQGVLAEIVAALE